MVALTGCVRSSLGMCASNSGAIAGCLLWKEQGAAPYDCSASATGKTIPGQCQGVTFESLGARYILVVEKDAIFTYLCGQRIWDSVPCIVVTGCGYPPLSVRATVKALATQLSLPVLGLFDYNPHGIQIMLTYKFGSVRMGLESHAHAVDLKWLGLHHDDIVEEGGRLRVDASALQAWAPSDHRVFCAVKTRVEAMMDVHYRREILLMEQLKVKAEIEAVHRSDSGAHLDSLENAITHKIVCKKYF